MLRLPSPVRIIVTPLVCALALAPGIRQAHAAEPSCEAVEQTEAMREAGRYREARTRLLECVNAQCGGDVRRRCAATLQKLDAITPSIVVRAEDEAGNDVTDVAVSMEGEELVSSLDGMAIPVDPGEHRFVFQRPGHDPVAQTLTIRQGEKFRPIDVRLGAEAGDLPPLSAEAAGSLSSSRLAAGATLIGVGLAGLGGFTWLGLKARSAESDLASCSPDCSRARVDTVETRYVLANVSLGVGVLALGGAAWVLLTGGPSGTVAQPVDGGIAVFADSEGGMATFSGHF